VVHGTQKSLRSSSRRWAGLDGSGPYSKRKANWLGKEESTERAAYFNGMNAPGNGAVQMLSGRVDRGLRRFKLPVCALRAWSVERSVNRRKVGQLVIGADERRVSGSDWASSFGTLP
jgi:hypothetical protein